MRRLGLFPVAVVAAVLLLATGVSGCFTSMHRNVQTVSTTPAARSYKPIDFKKWASGMYADEYFGKAVVVDGYFQKGLTGGTIHSEIPFFVRKDSLKEIQRISRRSYMEGTEAITLMVSVSAPLSMRDKIFPISNEQRVRVYGVVVNPYAISGITGRITSSTLQVKADRVEVVR